jgi:diketogulonate reductase-like aldo/keto reductase
MGLGTTRIRNLDDANNSMSAQDRNKDVEEVVYNSIKHGVRLIDTASKYENEVEVGKGIKKAIDEGIVKREELFIIGKLWIEDRKDPEAGLRETLKKLQLDYIDMYLDHWPSGNNYGDPNAPKQVPIFEMWPKMEQLVEKGLARSIGVSNYNVQSLLNLLSFCKIKPVANEVEFHPYYYQEGLKNFCDKEDIVLITYYPLAKGNGAKVYNKEHNDELDSFKEKAVVELAEKYGKTPGQIILNWHLAQGCIPIPGTSNPQRFRENLASLDFKLTDDEVKSLCVYGKKMKFCGCRRFFDINILA